MAHIRGGGELGEPWHDGGKMMTKRNTFTDFIACMEYLTANGYGAKDRVGIEGGSAGGLLMGAVTNLRPDLYRVVLAEVPFVDVMNTMLDASLPLTVGEYEEWGNPNEPAAFKYMLTYSPYDNVTAKKYPAMLVETSFRQPGDVLGAGEVCGQAASAEDGSGTTRVSDQHAWRAWRIERAI